MKKERLLQYARALAAHAEAPWVTPVFFFTFFLDSFLVFIPIDSLLGATVALRPRNAKKWVLAGIGGVTLGLGLGVVAANTFLHPHLLDLVHRIRIYPQVDEILRHAQAYGYFELTLGVFTVVPCIVGAIIGALLGLNPWAVLGIVVAAKVFRILLTVWLIHSGGTLLRKIVKFYLKIPA